LFLNTLGIAGLIAGVTLFARFPRLAAGWLWKFAGWLAFVTGCVLYVELISGPSQREIGKIFLWLVEPLGIGSPDKATIIDTIMATTNDNHLGLLGAVALAPRNIGYHVVHHVHPQVGLQALPQLREWYESRFPGIYPPPAR